MANRASIDTRRGGGRTKLYDRTKERLPQDEVERIRLWILRTETKSASERQKVAKLRVTWLKRRRPCR